MAYADQAQGGRRTFALAVVLALHLALAYAFITGLAFNVIKKTAADLKTFDVTEPPPPPAPPPPPPQVPKNLPPPPIVSPPPIVQAPTIQAPIFQTVPVAPPLPPRPATITAPPPPAPSKATGAKPRGTPGEWVTNDDYPSDAERENAEGTTGFKLDIDGTGKVTNCTVTQSSGNASLDQTACKLLPRRAHFTPAKDAAGNGIPDSYSSRIRWQIPKD